MRVVIADDHCVFRAGLKLVIETNSDFEVVAQAANGAQLFAVLDDVEADLVCLDINMPGQSGLDLLPELKQRHPALPILILSHHSERQMAVRAVRAGADGYLTKDVSPEELILAFEKLGQGKRYYTAEVTDLLARRIARNTDGPLHEKLSNRELRVFTMLAGGEAVSSIGEQLNLSPKTISTYRSRVLEKLGLATNADLVRYAVENRVSME